MSAPVWKVLVTGGRDWPENAAGRLAIYRRLARAKAEHPNHRMVLVEGAQSGADDISGSVGAALGYDVRPYAVDHAVDGPWPAAGPRRNARMLAEENRPDEPINEGFAFPMPGSRGTWDMVRRLRGAGIPVRETTLADAIADYAAEIERAKEATA